MAYAWIHSSAISFCWVAYVLSSSPTSSVATSPKSAAIASCVSVISLRIAWMSADTDGISAASSASVSMPSAFAMISFLCASREIASSTRAFASAISLFASPV